MKHRLLSLLGLLLAPIVLFGQTTINGARGFPQPNDGSTGSILAQGAEINASGNAVNASTTLTIPAFIVLAGAGQSGNATLAFGGIAPCKMDATVASNAGGYWIIKSATSGGQCHPQSAAPASGTWVYGFLHDSATASGSNALVEITSFVYSTSASVACGSLPALTGDTTTTTGSCATTTAKLNGGSFTGTNGHLVSFGATNTPADSGLVAANQVNASSPGAGLGHFAGSTQTLTSSAVVDGDLSGQVGLAHGGTNADLSAGGSSSCNSTGLGVLKQASSHVVSSACIGAADLPTAIPIGDVGSAGLSGTSPIGVASTGAVSCATCVAASSPGAGIAHFAGSTQTVTAVTDTRSIVFNLQAPASGDDNIYAIVDSPVAIHLTRFACGVKGTTSVVANLYESTSTALLGDQTCTAGDVEQVNTTTWANGSSQCGGTTSCAVAAHTPIRVHIGTISGTPTNLAIAIEYTVDGLN